MSLLTASGLALAYGELDVFSGIKLEVADRARIALIGPNGGGKTTLLRVLLGELTPNGGTISRTSGLHIGYVRQRPSGPAADTLQDEVMSAFDEVQRLEGEIESTALEMQHAEGPDQRRAGRRYSSLLLRYEALGGYDYQSRMERVVAGVGLAASTLQTPAAAASGGERTRAALARALLADPDLLVLDEPTNYLDFKGLDWLETFLSRFSHAFIVVSHDRYFLDRVVNQIWELDRGVLQTYPGNYTAYRGIKAERIVVQQREYERQQEYIAKEESFIQRYAAGQRSKEARGRATRLARLERVEAPTSDDTVRIAGVDAGRTGRVVLTVRDLEVGFVEGDRQVRLLSAPDLKLDRRSRTAVVGQNGVGKTTLLDTLLGLTPALAGTAELGHEVKVGYHRQGSDDLPEDSTVIDALLDVRNLQIGEARSYLARFMFRGDDVYQQVTSLSGGQRSRLALARLLLVQPNFLVLDEPTTHLDIPSREALEQTLLSYEGTLLLVSHDRHLISLLAQQLWIAEEGVVQAFAGPLEEWMPDAQEPVRRTPRPRKSAAGRRGPTPKKTAKKELRPPPPDHEAVIQGLESRLKTIEDELGAASERHDLEEIASLGEEYNRTQAQLEEAWKKWNG